MKWIRKKIAILAVIIGILFFFGSVVLGLSYFIFGGGANLPTKYVLFIFALFTVFIIVGFIMLFRSARLLSGDSSRLSAFMRDDSEDATVDFEWDETGGKQ